MKPDMIEKGIRFTDVLPIGKERRIDVYGNGILLRYHPEYEEKGIMVYE